MSPCLSGCDASIRGPLKFTIFQTNMENQLIVRTKKTRVNRPGNPQNRTVMLKTNQPPLPFFGSNPYGLNTNQVQFVPPQRQKSTKPKKIQVTTRNKSLAAKGTTRNQTSPKQQRRTLLIDEDEYIGEVSSSVSNTFECNSFPVNIGQASTFPWGSGVAKNNFELKVMIQSYPILVH